MFQLLCGCQTTATTKYRAGSRCYLDFIFSGLVPAKVLRVLVSGRGFVSTEGRVEVEVTESRGPYKKGEVLK